MDAHMIAERRLFFSIKGNADCKPLVIRVFAPQLVDPASVAFKIAAGTASCFVEFEGIPEAGPSGEIYGADLLQALQLAVNIEPTLKHLSKTYDFYFPTGEGYFDE